MPEHVSHEREVTARGEVGHVRLGRHVVEPDVGADGEVGRPRLAAWKARMMASESGRDE